MHHLVAANLGRRAFDDLTAVVHHRHEAGHRERDVHVVLDQDQRHVGRQPEQELGQPLALSEREAGRRLVEQHQPGLDSARHADLELSLLAVGEIADVCVGLVAEQHALGGRTGPHAGILVLLAGEHPEAPAVPADDGEEDVVLHRESRKEPRLLVRAGEPERRPDPGGEMRDVPSHHLDRSRRGLEVARDEVEERRLARAVRTQDRTAFAVRDVEIDVAYGLNSAEPPTDPPQAEDRLGVRGCCCGHRAT